jgi:hypothetical protein
MSTLYAVPLELLAVVMDREDDLAIGAWSYRRALSLYSLHCAGDPVLAGREPDPPRSRARLLWASRATSCVAARGAHGTARGTCGARGTASATPRSRSNGSACADRARSAMGSRTGR